MVATVAGVYLAHNTLRLVMPDGMEQGSTSTGSPIATSAKGWVQTIHSSQGATADRVLAHMESFRANTVDAASAYVAISRARTHAAIYTGDRSRLTQAIGVRDSIRVAALDQELDPDVGVEIA